MKRFTPFLIVLFVVIIAILPGIFLFIFEWPESWTNVFISWKNEGTLSYYSAIINTIGSVVLGAVSIWQTTKIKNDEQHDKNINTQRPFFVIDSVQVNNQTLELTEGGYVNTCEKDCHYKITLINCGNGPACYGICYPLCAIGSSTSDLIQIVTVPHGSIWEISISTNGIHDQFYQLHLYYQNMIGCIYEQAIDIRVKNSSLQTNQNEWIAAYTTSIHPISIQLPSDGIYYNAKTNKYHYTKNSKPIEETRDHYIIKEK